MATIPFPNVIPSSSSFGIKYNTQINTSTLSGSTQTIEIPGARWVCSLSFSDLEPYEGRLMSAFLAQLRGSSGRFFLTDFTHPAPRGSISAPGAVTVNGANQVGNTVTTSGWTASQSGLLLKGDYFQFSNGELKMVTKDVTSDVSGNATITFEPPIRISPSNAAAITLTDYSVTMMLSSNESRWTSNNEALLSNISIECIEGF